MAGKAHRRDGRKPRARGLGVAAGLAAGLLLTVAPLQGQSEAALKEYFEGRTVTVKIDMPATSEGIDVWPDARPPIDFAKYAQRIKQKGTALHAGDAVMVTKLKVKDDLIEFQLGGGGFGTFWDNSSSDVHVEPAEKTQREKNLERDVKKETDATKRRAMQEELDDLRKEREREDSRNRAAVAEAEEHKRQNVRQQALGGGSRFNLRYPNGVPGSALRPEAITAALKEYVQFDPTEPHAAPVAGADSKAGLRKGLSRVEVDALLGDPKEVTEGTEGSLRTLKAVYLASLGRVETLFVEGILVRYSVASD